MFIGELVKLRENVVRNNEDDQRFIKDAHRGDWIWLVTGMDSECLDFIIQPICLYDDGITELGASLMVLEDEIIPVKLTKCELFNHLININNCDYSDEE